MSNVWKNPILFCWRLASLVLAFYFFSFLNINEVNAAVVENSSQSFGYGGVSTSTAINIPTSCADPILVVSLTTYNDKTASMTYGGDSLTQLINSSAYPARYFIFYLTHPKTGTNNLNVNLSGGEQMAVIATVLCGVDQENPFFAYNAAYPDQIFSNIDFNDDDFVHSFWGSYTGTQSPISPDIQDQFIQWNWAVNRTATSTRSAGLGSIGWNNDNDGASAYIIYNAAAVLPECAIGFEAIGNLCIRQDSFIEGYFNTFTPYQCILNENCELYYYYNQNYVPEDTNIMNLYLGYGTSSQFLASSTIEDFSDIDKMAGGSYMPFVGTSTGKYIGYLIASSSDWIFASPVEIWVAASSSDVEATSTIDKLIQKGANYLKNAFPFNFFFAFKTAWASASSSTLPTELAFLDPTDSNGDVSVNLTSVVPGAPTSTLILYSDNYIATSTAAAIKGVSKWAFHGLLLGLIILVGIKSYKELFGIQTPTEEEKEI